MTAKEKIRGTQSLVHTFAECWSRPSLLALEVAWRWLFGAPALLLLCYEGANILTAAASQLEAAGIEQFTLQDPMRSIVIVADAIAILRMPNPLAVLESSRSRSNRNLQLGTRRIATFSLGGEELSNVVQRPSSAASHPPSTYSAGGLRCKATPVA